MKKILVVEDEILVQQLLQDNLEFEGYQVLACGTLLKAREGLSEKPDLVILDVNLPDGDGVKELSEWRKNGFVNSVIVCTIKDREIDVVRALDSGADDYVTKPFRIRELLSRVRAVLRRQRAEKSERVKIGDCIVNFSGRIVERAGVGISLTATEWGFLEYFNKNKNCVLSREQIIEHIWGVKDLEDSRAVDVHLARLRKKICDSDPPSLLITVRGLGYKLVG